MKKMTFALACASAVAAFAAAQDSGSVISSIGFEDYTLTGDPLSFTGLSGKTDAGVSGSATDSFWLYDGVTSGAADGSAVKKYGTPNLDAPTTGAAAGEKYLELSTEGGTLWRSINHLAGSETLGAAQQVDAETGLYIDTMVQFTPTEDGGDPTLDPADKIAIWLDVKGNVTNLCVRALQAKSEFSANVPQTFVLNNAAGNLTINAGEWYRLKVKVNRFMDVMTAYEIFIGNDQLKAVGDELPWDASSAALFAESPFKDQIAANQLFVSLQGMEEKAPALTAVGFKGSGAIDSLQFTTQDPGGEAPAPVVKVGLSISAENATVTGITAGMVEVGSSLTFTVTAAEGYNLTGVMINGTTVTADADGNYTYKVADTDEAVAVVVTVVAAAPAYPTYIPDNAAIKSKFDAWVTNKANGDRDAASANMDAFLLNVAPGEVTTAKANFKIVSIEQDANGAWVAKVTGKVGDGEAFGNGYVEIKGSATVDGTYNLATTAETARFFKAFLVLEAPTTK